MEKNYIVVRVSIVPAKQSNEKGQVLVNPELGKEYTTVVEPGKISEIDFGTKLLKKVREAAGMVQLAVAKTAGGA